MFSNVFDTLIFEEDLQKHINTANVEGMFYSSILSGLHPTLSLNQAVDSPALHEILKNDANSDFLNLVQNKTIRISRYKPEEDHLKDAIDAYIIPKLAGKKYCEFSSLTFLNEDNTKYSEKQKEKILKRLLECYTSSGIIMDTAFKDCADEDDRLTLYYWTDNLRRLKDAIAMNYLPWSGAVSKDTALYEQVMNGIQTSLKYCSDGFCSEELNAFQKYLRKAFLKSESMSKEEKVKYLRDLSSRSRMYKIIRDLKCDKAENNELKALVDLCYNEIVAKSISDTEDDIMVNNCEIQYAEILLESENVLDKDNQRLALAKNAIEGEHNFLTWADLNDILNTAKKKYNNSKDLDKWYITMQDTLNENGIKNITLETNKLLNGRFSFACSMAESIYGLLAKDSIDLAFGLIGVGTSALNMVFSRNKENDDYKKSVKKFLIYEQAQELLTQTALLKHNYNDPK